MPVFSLKQAPVLVVFLLCSFAGLGQNLSGQKIMVGADAPAFIIFNDEVINAEFNTADGPKFYNCKVRNNKSMSITFKGTEKELPDNIGLSVQEGKRTHYFIITFNKNYDINKDPSLWYDYSNLKELKKYVERQGASNKDELARLEAEERSNAQKEEANREKQVAASKKQQEAEAEKRKKELEEASRKEAARQQELEAKLAKAKEEEQKKAAEKKKAEELARQKEEERKRIEALLKADEQKQKEQEQTAKKKQEEDRKKAEAAAKAKEEQEKKEAEAAARKKEEEERKLAEKLAKMKEDERLAAEAVEKKRKEEEQKKADELAKKKKEEERLKAEALAKEEAKRKEEEKKKNDQLAREEAKRKEEERKRQEAAAAAKAEEERKKKEHEEALARLKQLEEEKERQRQEKAYSRAGLWERYGSKGINVFDMPEKQALYNNSDFYLTSDTLRNYEVSQSLLQEKPVLNIASQSVVNGGVSMVLENIRFSGSNAYFKILISNKSKDDFLMGPVLVRWYNADETYRKPLRCSYITYIQSFPIVPPGQETRIVVVTREANVQDAELLNVNISERRTDRQHMDIVFDGKVYNKERMKIEKSITVDTIESTGSDAKTDKKGKKEKKKK